MHARSFLAAFSTLAALLCLCTQAHAQGIGTIPIQNPPITYYTAGVSFELVPGLEPGAPTFDIAPGSSFPMDVNLFVSDGADAAHSFSFTVSGDDYLTFDGFTPSLPPGWEISSSGNSFDVQNTNGEDIQSTLGIDVGEVNFSVDLNAPVGTILTLPTATDVGILNDDNQQTVTILNFGYISGPTVVPEPSATHLGVITLLVLMVANFVRRMRLGQYDLKFKSSR